MAGVFKMDIKFSDQFINPKLQEKQYKLVMDYLKKGNTLSTFEAFVRFNIPNLSQRVQDLRRKGYLIDSIPVQHKGRRFVVYRWSKDNASEEAPVTSQPTANPSFDTPTTTAPVKGAGHE